MELVWTVDYGSGPRPVKVPHVFWDDRVDIRWEGPATYRTTADAALGRWLVFEGVSYRAVVKFDGEEVLTHFGMWDAFSIDLSPWAGRSVAVEVLVTKNGGPTFPVKDVLSGFLPYVDSTFGGLYRPVRLVDAPADPVAPKPKPRQRIGVQGTKLWLDDRPWMMRGVLTWGWYPEYRHPAPPLSVFEEDWRHVAESGFNTVKFCLWLPPHYAIEALKKRDLTAWIELPLWMPTGDAQRLAEMEDEVRRIVGQYRHHDNIVCWTAGCELGESTPPEFRKRLVDFIREETGCPLVKDNSGGAEMYGGDPREYGTFDDFHPYCDLMYYPQVLQSLAHGPREQRPILLGEFNDFDHVRDLNQLARHLPYWASADPAVNDQGVRWQYDFPGLLERREGRRWPDEYNFESASWACGNKSKFIRKRVMEAVASQDDIAGWVVTGWDDTPISTSGVKTVREGSDVDRHYDWVAPTQFFVIPRRRPPWVIGGNRPGWQSVDCYFEGLVRLSIGARVPDSVTREFVWSLTPAPADCTFGGVWKADFEAGVPREVASIDVVLSAGRYRLSISYGNREVFSKTFTVVARLSAADLAGYRIAGREGHPLAGLPWDASGRLVSGGPVMESGSVVAFGVEVGATPAPFWRECFQLWSDGDIIDWHALHDVASDHVLPPEGETLLERIDTRTYKSGAYIARLTGGQIVTTLRPWGGLGVQPHGVEHNAAGHALIRQVIQWHRKR